MSKTCLKLDWCSHEAAEYAVKNWHYSKRMPIGKMVKIGVWENSVFVGCVLFARGNTPTLGDAYELGMMEVCELVRIALTAHQTPVSRIMAIALKMLKKQSQGLRLVVSFADPEQGHHGGIYQANGWIYSGDSSPSWQWIHNGVWKHNREMTSGAFGKKRAPIDLASLPRRLPPGKRRYLYPFDEQMRAQIEPLRRPYPKREIRAGSIESDAVAFQVTESGATPTSALLNGETIHHEPPDETPA